MKGITLIGMPGAGKSTIGRKLAGQLNRNFIDLDLVFKEKTGKKPADFIKEKGEKEFLRLEEELALALDLRQKVFAPGGSIIYAPTAMEKIKIETKVFFLDLPVEEIKKRLGNNPEARGIIGLASAGLENLFEARTKIYQSFADKIIACQGISDAEIIERIKNKKIAV